MHASTTLAGFFSWSHSSQKESNNVTVRVNRLSAQDHPGVLDGVTLAEAVEARHTDSEQWQRVHQN